jgi:hypothetical protein
MGMGLSPGYRTGSSLNYGVVLPHEYAVGIHPFAGGGENAIAGVFAVQSC